MEIVVLEPSDYILTAPDPSAQVIVAEPSILQVTGGGSGGTSAYEHVQNIASATWTVNHLLGYRPNVSVKTAGGLEVMAEILHNSVNQTTIYLDSPMTGIANFS